MKNLVFAFAILFGSMLCACGGRSTTTTEPTIDSVEVVTDSMPSDSLIVDSIAVDTVTVSAAQ